MSHAPAHYADVVLSAPLKAAVKAALGKNANWNAYRAGKLNTSKGEPLHTGNASRAELLVACEACGVDVFSLAAQVASSAFAANNGALPAGFDDVDAPDEETAPAEGEEAAQAPAVNNDGEKTMYEGADPAALVNETLSSVSAFLSPAILKPLRESVAGLAAAAAAGPRTITETRIVTKHVSSDGIDVTPQAPHANLVAKVAARKALGGVNVGSGAWDGVLDGAALPVYDSADAPRVDKDYVWQAEMASCMAICDRAGQNLWLAGAAGTGKTEGARQYAARLRRPFVRIAINRTTEPVDLIGQTLPKQGGGTVWSDGPLTRAWRTPGCVVLVDEPTLLRPGSMAIFQTILDIGVIYLPTGEIVEKAPGVFVIAADNTMGSGDETGRYADTAPMNVALVDRFDLMCRVDYLPQARERDLLASKTGLAADACALMVKYAGLTRKGADDGKLTMGLTLRRLLAWARAVKAGVPSAHAFRLAVITQADPADRETLKQLETTQGPHTAIDAHASGQPVTDPTAQGQTVTPQGAAAAAAFPAF